MAVARGAGQNSQVVVGNLALRMVFLSLIMNNLRRENLRCRRYHRQIHALNEELKNNFVLKLDFESCRL